MAQESSKEEETGDIFVYQQDTNDIPTDIVRLVTDPLVHEFPKHAFSMKEFRPQYDKTLVVCARGSARLRELPRCKLPRALQLELLCLRGFARIVDLQSLPARRLGLVLDLRLYLRATERAFHPDRES